MRKRKLHKLAGIWYIPLGNGWNISFHRMSALICLCYILTIIYCLKSSQITAITFSVLLIIYMFMVLFVILPQVYILSFFLPVFLGCLRLTNKFDFHFWCRVRMVFDATWIFQLYGGDQFYWWRKSEHSKNTTNLSLVADKLYHIMFHRIHLTMDRIRNHNLVILLVTYAVLSPTIVGSWSRHPLYI
jgi:hypothetical protein